jgi:hypothetical protein
MPPTHPTQQYRLAFRVKTADKSISEFENIVLMKVKVSISRFYK